MRRFVTLAVLVFFAIPFGVSISGCSHAVAPTYCNGQTSGVQVGQLTTLDLEPRLTGISLNQGEMGRVNSPTGKDCRGNSANASSVTYASTNINIADIAPTTGALCGGSWNRNTGAGIADYTVCTPTPLTGIAYVTASSGGVVSNPIAIFIHPVVTNIVLGPASTNCTTDPASNCVDLTQSTGFDSGPISGPAGYNGAACVSQGQTAQLVARSYTGVGISPANNISAVVGPLTFSAQTPAVVTIDANGLATAAAPGSSTITANISQASSTAGFFNTCPPASIVLSIPPSTTAPTSSISVNQNTNQTFTTTVTDVNGVQLSNVTLEYISTTPTTIPTSGASTTPTYPGAGTIFAVCLPPSCNPSPFNEIGLLGNGLPVVSNPVQIASTGTNFSSVLYVASTNSQYILPIDFTVSTQPSPVRLPYAPNSMVMSEDQGTIYMGTPYEIMVYSTGTNTLTRQDTSISGTVLAVSDDNNTVVVTDPIRQLTYLYLSAGGVSTEYGGTATSAQFSPDSQTVYITTADGRLLVHSSLSGWSSIPLTAPATDVAVTVPQAGVYLAGNPVDVRTNCPATTINNPGQGFLQTTTNTFYPDLGPVAGANAISLAATNDGKHIFGVNTTSFTDIVTNRKSGPCPISFTSAPNKALALGTLGAIATANTATGSYTPNLPTPYVVATSDSAYAFVSYQVAASQTTAAVVPQYSPATGALTNIALSTANGTPTAPVAEVISADNNTLFVGTSGDNAVHLLTRGTTGFADTPGKLINPALPALNGGFATPNLLAQHPRKSTS
jgi:hypothetical protein